jgi:hypothetical protein
MGGAQSSSGGVADLPYSFGRKFETLDAYLNHLECNAGPIDLPWWKEVRPGVFQEMTSVPEARAAIATRAELMTRYGFDR